MVSTDLSILATAANQLFQSTAYMSPEAVGHVAVALVEVSRRAMPSFQANPAQPRPAALGRLVETMLVNLPRIVVGARTLPAAGALAGHKQCRTLTVLSTACLH